MVKKMLWKLWLVIIAFLILLAPFASSLPDGLERVAHDLGFINREKAGAFIGSPFPDYSVSLLGTGRWSTWGAGVIGVTLVWLISYGLGLILRRDK